MYLTFQYKSRGSDSDGSDFERSEMYMEKKKKKLEKMGRSSIGGGGGSPQKRVVKRAADIDLDALKVPLDMGAVVMTRDNCIFVGWSRTA